MTWDDTPDYSNYSVDELCDVARRVDRERFPERYQSVLEELEKRPASSPTNSFVEPRSALLTRAEVFQPGQGVRDYQTISGWWKQRRLFYNRFLLVLILSSALTTLFFLFLADWRENGLPSLSQFVGDYIPTLFFFLNVAIVIVLLAANIAYTFVYLFDWLLSYPLRFLGWQVTSVNVALVLGFTLFIVALPALAACVLAFTSS